MQYLREDLRSRSPSAPVTGQVVASATRPIYLSISVHVDHRLCITCDHFRSSPFGKLPVEVVCEIFSFICGTGLLAPCQRTREPPRRTLQLVCKNWRQTVVNFASLWNDLDLRIMEPEHGPYDSGVSLTVIDALLCRARSWLRNAGSSPLSLHLLIAWCDEVAEVRRRIFSFLSAYTFKQLAVISLFPPILDLDASLNASLSRVETLSLTTPTWLALPIQLFTNRFQFSALKSLELAVDVGHTYKHLLSAFPWHQLDRLFLGTVRRSDLLVGILRQCKSLVDCTIYIEQDDTSFIPLQDILLPQLHRLTIICDIVGPITDAILHCIVVPNLESLSISGDSEYGSSPLTFHEVEAMARRSGFGDRLQKLVLRNLYKAVDLGRLLRFIPSLNIARVSGTIDDEDMLHVANGLLGPRLAHISLAGCDLKLDALLDMVEQRQINASKEGSMIESFITASFLLHQCQMDRLTDEHYERAANLEDEFNFEIGFGEEGEEVDEVMEDEAESAWWI